MDRRTATKYIKAMQGFGLIEKCPDGGIKLKKLPPTEATLVPYITLRRLVNALHKNSVSIFIYLLNRYVANGEKGFYVTYTRLKEIIGISTSSTSNNKVVADILYVLAALQLVDYQLEQVEVNKTCLFVKKVANIVGNVG